MIACEHPLQILTSDNSDRHLHTARTTNPQHQKGGAILYSHVYMYMTLYLFHMEHMKYTLNHTKY